MAARIPKLEPIDEAQSGLTPDMAARIPKLEPIDETQPGPTQDLDQAPAQDFVPVVMQDFGHAPIHDFGQAPAQDPVPQPFPGPAQIPAPVTGYHRDIILPALVEISGAIRNHDRRLDNCVTKADIDATTEVFTKSQQAQERRIDALPNAEAFAALVNENADLKKQLRVKDELVESLRRTGERGGEPERDDALPLRRVSASEGSRPARANSHQVRPDLAGMGRHGEHVEDPITLSGNGNHGAPENSAPGKKPDDDVAHGSERLRVKMEIDDGDGNMMDLEEGAVVDAALVDQKALVSVQDSEDNSVSDDYDEITALLNSARARHPKRPTSPFPGPPLTDLNTMIMTSVVASGKLKVPRSSYDDSYVELAKIWHTQMQELRFMNESWFSLDTKRSCLRTSLLGRHDRWSISDPGRYACGHCADERKICLRRYKGYLVALPVPPEVLEEEHLLIQVYIPGVKLIARTQEGLDVWQE